jgi:RNA polymerase sigma factor (sigma-70 family)
MAGERLGPVIRRLCGAVEPPGADAVSDAELLQRFVGRRDAAAFELLVWRHGGLVLGACRRVLGRSADAEDAFQATFLTLLRKAGSIGRRQALAAWLFRVAHRIAVRARQNADRQRRRELRAEPPRPPADRPAEPDLRAVLDEEVGRLPAAFRLPVILCYLEGLTNEEAARRLGCPKGTVLSRLARARQRLRVNLTRRGLAPAVVAAALAGPAATEALPPALVAATVRLTPGGGPAAVAALAHGELRAMTLKRAKTVVAAVLMLAVGGSGAGLLGRTAPGAPPGEPADKPGGPVELNGRWVLQSITGSAAREGESAREAYRLRPTGLGITWDVGGGTIQVSRTWTDEADEAPQALYHARYLGEPHLSPLWFFPDKAAYRLPAGGEPRPIDLTIAQESWAGRGQRHSYLGVYRVGDGRLTLALSGPDARAEADRPTDFAPRPGRGEQVLTFTREKPAAGSGEGRPDPPAKGEGPADRPALSFESAELEQTLSPSGGIYFPSRRAKLLTPAGAARLASFFPGLGEGKRSAVATGWKAGLTVTFRLAGATAPGGPGQRVIDVRANPALTTWTEDQNKGDWAVKPGLAEFLDDLFRSYNPAADRPPPAVSDGAWSAPDNGLRGRLLFRPRAVAEEYGPALRGVTLEVENSNRRGLMVRPDPQLAHFQLTDAAGRPVPEKQFGRYTGIIPISQSAIVPHAAYLGFPLDNYSRVVPKEGGTGLVLGGQCWLLAPGRYTLSGTFRFTKEAGARERMPEDAWVGELVLPPLTIEVR